MIHSPMNDGSEQGSLFGSPDHADKAKGELLRELGMGAAYDGATDRFKIDVVATIKKVAHSGAFAADDVWLNLPPESKPIEPRALGPVIMQLARRGFIQKTGEYKNSVIPQCHARPKPVWSLAA